jgi:hypothetical protein
MPGQIGGDKGISQQLIAITKRRGVTRDVSSGFVR